MNNELRRQIEKVKPQFIKDAKAIAAANKIVHVNGTRYKLPLEGREIEIVYYKEESENAPLIVGYHGGGFLNGGCALDDELWCQVIKTLDVNVASVGYRMSPDYRWEACLSDAYDSVIYLKEYSSDFGFDGENISVMGQSAGGNLAVAVSLKMAETKALTLKNEILVYPFLDVYTDPDSKGEGSFSGLTAYVMNDLHCSEEEAKNPYCSPYYATDDMMKDLPNMVCIFAEDDNLRPEAERYCERLKALNVPVHTMLAKNMPHGYLESGFRKRLRKIEFELLGPKAEEITADGSLRRTSEDTIKFIKENMI